MSQKVQKAPMAQVARCEKSSRAAATVVSPECDDAARGRTLVLGLGNPILKDDAVGIIVAREVERLLAGRMNTEVREASLAGFELLDLLAGFQRAILIDAIKTPNGKPGDIYRLLPDQMPVTDRIAAMHEINLPTALALGRKVGMEMPTEVVTYAIEVEDYRTFGETMSPSVSAAVGIAADRVAREVLAGR